MHVPEWHTTQGTEGNWFTVIDRSDDGGFSVWLNEAQPPRYGWLRSEIIGVLGGWALLLLASWGSLWAMPSRRWVLAAIFGVLMFIGAAIASESVPDGTTIQDTVRDKELLFRHAMGDKGWDAVQMEAEFRRMLAVSNPRYVKGGRKAILRRLR